MNRQWKPILLAACWLGATGIAAAQLPPPPGRYATPANHWPSIAIGKPIVATTYFYWYDQPSGLHTVDHDGSDALTDHPIDLTGLSFHRVEWHAQQLRDMMASGIDVLLPVYWGVPGVPRSWSNDGIPPLVAAREQLVAAGLSPPRIGMFYDTSTLRHNPQHIHVDLRTEEGQRWFYATIRDFFSLVPPAHRAAIDGRPLVFLYSPSFAAGVDDQLFPRVREMFSREFGADLYLVKMASWPGAADGRYQWGGALQPRYLDVAGIGPGYDHSAVPGRQPLVRDREDGAFYGRAWEKLLIAPPASRPWLVHLETWNEFHEGTDLCESREYGRQYIQLTRRFTDLFHNAKQIKPQYLPAIAPSVRATPTESLGLQNLALPEGDGPVEIKQVAGRPAWCTTSNRRNGPNRYLYFQVDPNFLLLGEPVVRLTVNYHDHGAAWFLIEYDSCDPQRTGLAQQFRPGHRQPLEGTGTWRQVTFDVPYPRFARRANGADFRLTCHQGELAIGEVVLSHVALPSEGKRSAAPGTPNRSSTDPGKATVRAVLSSLRVSRQTGYTAAGVSGSPISLPVGNRPARSAGKPAQAAAQAGTGQAGRNGQAGFQRGGQPGFNFGSGYSQAAGQAYRSSGAYRYGAARAGASAQARASASSRASSRSSASSSSQGSHRGSQRSSGNRQIRQAP